MVSFRGTPVRTGGVIGRAGGPGGVSSPVRIVGIPQTLAKLKGVDSVVRLELGLMAKGAAEFVNNRAKEYVPVETGNLREGIDVRKVASYSYEVFASSEDGPVTEKNWYEYAPFVEYGTSNMEGRFFMTRAFEDVKPIVAAELRSLAAKLNRL